LGKIITKIGEFGSKKAGLSSDLWENCKILKKISIGKRPFLGVCYIVKLFPWGVKHFSPKMHRLRSEYVFHTE
jgi:hypothetical protein